MNQANGNTCARCGVPIKPDQDLCKVCAADATSRTSISTVHRLRRGQRVGRPGVRILRGAAPGPRDARA